MKRLLSQVMLLAVYDNVGMGDRIKYIWNAILHFAPIALVLDLFRWWFKENHQFGTFMCIALIINLVIGTYMHKKSGTFCFKQFIVLPTKLVLKKLNFHNIEEEGRDAIELLLPDTHVTITPNEEVPVSERYGFVVA